MPDGADGTPCQKLSKMLKKRKAPSSSVQGEHRENGNCAPVVAIDL